ncbi:fibronectin type III domain-containing protein [bacterium]|nr:fibronectin type III domain-containing protein [bacterium]
MLNAGGKYHGIMIGVLAFFFLLPSQGQAEAGKSGWPIFKKVQTASFKGTAALSPVDGNVSGVLYNPALLGTVYQPTMLLTSELGLAEDKLGGLFYYMPWNKSVFAGGLTYYNAGSIELNWLDDNTLQSETVNAQQDFMCQVSYAYRQHKSFWAGISLKLASSELIQRATAMALAVDVGLAVRPIDQWVLSLALQNMGFSTPYQDQEVPLPSSFYLGSGYLFQGSDWHALPGVSLTYNWVDTTVLPELGIELKYNIALVNVGYRMNTEEAKLHLGLGVQWHNLEINYSFIPGIFLDPTHCISAAWRFGDTVPTSAKSDYSTSFPRSYAAPRTSSWTKTELKDKPRRKKVARYSKKVPRVQGIRLTRTGQRVKITWKKPRSRQSFRYNVYLKIGNGKYRKINTRSLSKTNYAIKIPKRKQTYYISITCINARGQEGYRTKAKRFVYGNINKR